MTQSCYIGTRDIRSRVIRGLYCTKYFAQSYTVDVIFTLSYLIIFAHWINKIWKLQLSTITTPLIITWNCIYSTAARKVEHKPVFKFTKSTSPSRASYVFWRKLNKLWQGHSALLNPYLMISSLLPAGFFEQGHLTGSSPAGICKSRKWSGRWCEPRCVTSLHSTHGTVCVWPRAQERISPAEGTKELELRVDSVYHWLTHRPSGNWNAILVK